MKYPCLSPCLLYKKEKEDEYSWYVKDYATGNVYIFDVEEVRFMRQLNGKRNPYEINPDWSRSEIRQLLNFLEEKELTRYSRVSRLSLLTFSISLFKIKRSAKLKLISIILNTILMTTFLPVLAAGLYCFINNTYTYEFSLISFFIGSAFGVIFGMIFHEAGHAISGLSYGAKVFEAGLLLGIQSGAYVIINERNVKSRLKRCQLLAAGVEMNFLLCGIGFILFSLIPCMGSFFYGFAIDNALLGAINLLFINGLDGCKIIEELLGTKSLSLSAVDFVWSKKTRENLLSQGVTGYVKIASAFVGAIFQLAYPLLLIINIAGVVSCVV